MLVHSGLSPQVLAAKLGDARARLNAFAETLEDSSWVGGYAPTLNPPLWEYGHIVWFQEHWCLRLKPGIDPGTSPLLQPLLPARRPWADWLYNSSHIPHAARWKAPLPSASDTMAYGKEVLDAVADKLIAGRYSEDYPYYVELSLYHELMHSEALWMMWQQLGRRPPSLPTLPRFSSGARLRIARGPTTLGSPQTDAFVFDNEKWAHAIELDAFEIDAHPVSCADFAQFIEAGGYANDGYWTAAGKAWRKSGGAIHPVYWRKCGQHWQQRRFDHWIDCLPDEPVLHVCMHEAQAYCAWRGRSLPSAAQWARAAAEPGFQCGRCWEWTRDAFAPYPDFTPDPYRDYSQPWFHTHAELRGAGSWVTDPALARPTYRNFYTPDRCDPFVGFRTVDG
jgi:ergothioneine biosynthesis protein EgtB